MSDASILGFHLPFSFRRYVWVVLGAVLLLAGSATTSTAATIDLTSFATVSGSGANQLPGTGELFFADWVNSQSTGTGVVNSFLRIENNGTTEQGYNTSIGNPMDDQPGHNKAITLSDVKTTAIVVGGVTYYRFLLDINQLGSAPLLSLNQVQIFSDPVDPGSIGVASPTPTPLLSLPGATERFRMSQSTYPNSGGGTQINLNGNLNSGLGAGDMMLFVNASLFAGVSDATDVILYSQFGNPPGAFAVNGIYEEWSLFSGPCITASCGVTPITPVPEPASLVLLGTGLAAVVRHRRRKSSRCRSHSPSA